LVSHLLESIPPEAVYLIVGLMIMVESLGIPVPGEIALVTAAVLATQHKLAVAPEWIAASASAGAIAGDSIGFYIGHRVGKPLFDWLGRKFPRHFGPSHVAVAERFFTRHGAWAVFFGRFIALLRIFSGPLAGSLHMPYGRFLLANASGGIIWASGITYLIWFLGQAAEKWLSRVSWIGLVAAVVVGLAVTLLIRRRTSKLVSRHEAESAAAEEAEPAAGPREEEAPSPASTPEAPSPASTPEAPFSASTPEAPFSASDEAPSSASVEQAGPEEAGPAAGHRQARPPGTDGEARRPAGNGKVGPLARQRTDTDR
jgi:membrane protein DedA with SNARE-associated domain